MILKRELRSCPICGESMHRYRETKHQKNGETYGRWDCIPCNQTVQRARIRSNKLKGIGYLGGKCLDCGQTFEGYPSVFDFHHRDPATKTKKPCNLLGGRWEKIRIELDKCDLLCSNCHRKRHHEDKEHYV